MDLRRHYHESLERMGWQVDGDQLAVVEALSRLEKQLNSSALSQWFNPPQHRGLYIWGDTGRGKTMLMDLFSTRHPDCSRVHFYRFMQQVHEHLRSNSGHPDPLREVAVQVTEKARLLCLDEFFVSDIGDAMILGRLFAHLFENGICMVLTSNLPPEDLYRNGLHRERFLPSIDLIQRQLEVIAMHGDTDYRYRALRQNETYIVEPDAQIAEGKLRAHFERLAGRAQQGHAHALGRRIPTLGMGNGAAWFSFADLCCGARAATDYLALAREYHTIFLGPIPSLADTEADAVRRFIALVDTLYDRACKLVVAAPLAVEKLYAGNALAFEFRRTRSRLLEMQSDAYLSRQLQMQ